MATCRRLCLMNDAVLYEDELLQVSVAADQCRKHGAALSCSADLCPADWCESRVQWARRPRADSDGGCEHVLVAVANAATLVVLLLLLLLPPPPLPLLRLLVPLLLGQANFLVWLVVEILRFCRFSMQNPCPPVFASLCLSLSLSFSFCLLILVFRCVLC